MSVKMKVEIEGDTQLNKDLMVEFMSISLPDMLACHDGIIFRKVAVESPTDDCSQNIVFEIDIRQ